MYRRLELYQLTYCGMNFQRAHKRAAPAIGSKILSSGIAAGEKENKSVEDERWRPHEESPYMTFDMIDLVHCSDRSHRSGRV